MQSHTDCSSLHVSLVPPMDAAAATGRGSGVGTQAASSSALSPEKTSTSALSLSPRSCRARGAAHQSIPVGGACASTSSAATATCHLNPTSHGTPTHSDPSPGPRKDQPPPHTSALHSESLDAPSAVANTLEAMILTKGKTCKLSYFPSRGLVSITRVLSNGKTRTILKIPVRIIINIEATAERDARQRVRQANDDAIKLTYAENNRSAGSILCTFPSGTGEENDALVFAHSRVNTASSISLCQSGPSFGQSSPQSDMHTPGTSIATAASSSVYYFHYVQQRSRENPSIRTLVFQSSGSAEAVHCIVSRVVQRIYQRGSKHMIVFISAKSGKGKGLSIFEKQVRPMLHFSRHTYEAYMTSRAHDCEDYLANLENPMNDNTVIVTVGGDGMVHEAVNGVHRRKLALLRWLRSVTSEADKADSTNIWQNGLSCLGNVTCKFCANAQSLTAQSDKTLMAVLTKASSTNKGTPLAEVGTCPVLSPIRDGREGSTARGCSCCSVATSGESTARRALELASRLVKEGCDSLVPLIATVATGSACGLAKSLGVLSFAEAAVSLVHLNTVHMDLMMMNFTPNGDMIEFHRSRMGARQLDAAKQKFLKYKKEKAPELQERSGRGDDIGLPSGTLTAVGSSPPFLKDGSAVYRDVVSFSTGMPELHSRVSFMSLSFGAANDIDHGSESLRWMGNARFHVYGGYMVLRGPQRYNGSLRYLPWETKDGRRVEKLLSGSKMPTSEEIPVCTQRDDCPHCRQYTFAHCGAPSVRSSVQAKESPQDSTRDATQGNAPASSAAATLAPFTDQQLLDEDVVDFDDEQLPWVTIRGDFCIVLMCNVRDVAQDMLMAPLAHMSDGAIDVVYCRIDPTTGRGGRLEMVKFFMALESGSHVHLDFVSYLKARALEIKVDAGISMSDGELMPLSSVRVTKMRRGVQFVRSG